MVNNLPANKRVPVPVTASTTASASRINSLSGFAEKFAEAGRWSRRKWGQWTGLIRFGLIQSDPVRGLSSYGLSDTWPGWSGLAWSNLAWSSLVWSSLVWSGLVWSGTCLIRVGSCLVPGRLNCVCMSWSGLTWPDPVWSGLVQSDPVWCLALSNCELAVGCDCVNVGASSTSSTSGGLGLRRVGVCGGCMGACVCGCWRGMHLWGLRGMRICGRWWINL